MSSNDFSYGHYYTQSGQSNHQQPSSSGRNANVSGSVNGTPYYLQQHNVKPSYTPATQQRQQHNQQSLLNGDAPDYPWYQGSAANAGQDVPAALRGLAQDAQNSVGAAINPERPPFDTTALGSLAYASGLDLSGANNRLPRMGGITHTPNYEADNRNATETPTRHDSPYHGSYNSASQIGYQQARSDSAHSAYSTYPQDQSLGSVSKPSVVDAKLYHQSASSLVVASQSQSTTRHRSSMSSTTSNNSAANAYQCGYPNNQQKDQQEQIRPSRQSTASVMLEQFQQGSTAQAHPSQSPHSTHSSTSNQQARSVTNAGYNPSVDSRQPVQRIPMPQQANFQRKQSSQSELKGGSNHSLPQQSHGLQQAHTDYSTKRQNGSHHKISASIAEPQPDDDAANQAAHNYNSRNPISTLSTQRTTGTQENLSYFNKTLATPTTVDPSQVYDPSHEYQRQLKISEAETARKAGAQKLFEASTQSQVEATILTNNARPQNRQQTVRPSNVAEQSKEQLIADQASPTVLCPANSGKGDMEVEMRQMVEKMRDYQAKNPSLFLQVWEQVKKGKPSTKLSPPPTQAPKATAQSSPSGPSRANETAASVTIESRRLQSPTSTPVQAKGISTSGRKMNCNFTEKGNLQKSPVPAMQTLHEPSRGDPSPEATPSSGLKLMQLVTPTTKLPVAIQPPARTVWPESKKAALAEAAAKALASAKENEGKVITSQQICVFLDKNPSYIELCESLEAMEFMVDRAKFARMLLSAVPDANSAAPARSTSQASRAPQMLQNELNGLDPVSSNETPTQDQQSHNSTAMTSNNRMTTPNMRESPGATSDKSKKGSGRPRKDRIPVKRRAKAVGMQERANEPIAVKDRSAPSNGITAIQGQKDTGQAHTATNPNIDPRLVEHDERNGYHPSAMPRSALNAQDTVPSLAQTLSSPRKESSKNSHLHACALCYAQFRQIDSLKRHMEAVHDRINNPSGVGPVNPSTTGAPTDTRTISWQTAVPAHVNGQRIELYVNDRSLTPAAGRKWSAEVRDHGSQSVVEHSRQGSAAAGDRPRAKRDPLRTSTNLNSQLQFQPPKPMSKEETARKRTFAEIVDFTQDSSDDQDLTKRVKKPRLEQDTTLATNGIIHALEESMQTISPNTKDNGVHSPILDTPDAAQSSDVPAVIAIKINPLRSSDVVTRIDRKKALRTSNYNAKTIARDILIATGRHPHMRPLNAHLEILKNNFRNVDALSDLSTFHWDLVDPEEPENVSAINLNHEAPYAHSEGEEGGNTSSGSPQRMLQTRVTSGGEIAVEAITQSSRSARAAKGQVMEVKRKERQQRISDPLRPTTRPRLSIAQAHSTTSTNRELGERKKRKYVRKSDPTRAFLGSNETSIMGHPEEALSTDAGTTIESDVRTNQAPQSAEQSDPPKKRRGRPPGSGKRGSPGSKGTTSASGSAGPSLTGSQYTIPDRPRGITNTTPSRPSGLRHTLTASGNVAVVIQSPSPNTKSGLATGPSERKRKSDFITTSKHTGDGHPEPSYTVYNCQWKECRAKLHNVDTLRKHLQKIHRARAPHGGLACLWTGCSKATTENDSYSGKTETKRYPYDFSTEAQWDNHVDKKHLESLSWKFGDGPSAGRSEGHDSEASDYLSDNQGRQLTPQASATGPRDAVPAGLKPNRAFHKVHGNKSTRERAKEVERAIKKKKRDVGPGFDRGGSTMLNDTRRLAFVDDEDVAEEVDEEED
ncbi:MAG: hypothetical protein M1827_006137 [Pycnora praestabilis]|nr:MAG: hypothetical protein M1827_006137 [Pycnora praestabilis]